jgi:Tfp pilus assembly protein PilF
MKRGKKIFAICLIFLFGFSTFYAGCSSLRGTSGNMGQSQKGISGAAGIAEFFAGIRSAKGNPESHYLLACYYQDRGKNREAIEEFKKVLAIDPEYVKAINGLGVSFDLLGEYVLANEFYKLALAKNPNLDYVKNNWGYSLILQKKVEDAIPALKEAVALNVQESLFHNNLGLAYARSGQFDLALKEFSSGGDEAKAHFNIAEVYFEKGLYKEAQSHYAEALKRDPSSTLTRTTSKAAESLARVFQPAPASVEPTRFLTIIPAAEPKATVEKETLPAPLQVQPAVEEALKTPEIQVEPVKGMPVETVASNLPTNLPTPADTLTQPVETLPAESSPRTVQVAESHSANGNGAVAHYEVQAGAFASLDNAIKGAGTLQEKGYPVAVRSEKDGKGAVLHRVLVGSFDSRAEAESAKGKIVKANLTVPIIRVSKEENKPSAAETPVKMISANSKAPIKRVGIEISNGNGVNRMAKNVGEYLKTQGHDVKRLTNAKNFNYGKSKVYYQEGHSQEARQVADQLPKVDEFIGVKKLDRPDIQVKILIGKDMVPQLKRFEPKG